MICRWRSGISALISLTCLGVSISLPGAASAATAIANNTIRVTPTMSNILLAENETSTTIDATVTNLTSAPLHVGLSVQDFGASSSRAGAIQLYGAGYNPNTNPHSLQTAISLPASVILLAPRQTQKVIISLNNLSKLAPGGHYGAILFNPEVVPDGASGTNVSINSSVASLIFLTTATGGTEPLSLTSFPVRFVNFTLPSTTHIAFQDSGNSQTSPQGQLTLYSPSGSLVSTMVLNPGEGLVLPGTTRLFTAQLPLTGLRFAWPGMYRLELQYKGRTSTTYTVVSKRFLYINLAVIIPFILLCSLLLFVLRRYWIDIVDVSKWLSRHIKRLFKKKQPPVLPPEKPQKPKRPNRLIQG